MRPKVASLGAGLALAMLTIYLLFLGMCNNPYARKGIVSDRATISTEWSEFEAKHPVEPLGQVCIELFIDERPPRDVLVEVQLIDVKGRLNSLMFTRTVEDENGKRMDFCGAHRGVYPRVKLRSSAPLNVSRIKWRSVTWALQE
jgi:hypothetical protein